MLLTGIHLMRTGEIQANLVVLNHAFKLSWIDDLVAAKTQGAEAETLEGVDLEFHAGEFARLQAELGRAGEQTSLPKLPTTRADLNALLLRLRQRACREWAG